LKDQILDRPSEDGEKDAIDCDVQENVHFVYYFIWIKLTMSEIFKTIPLDGAVITIATWFLSPQETRVRNTIVIGVLHGALHKTACRLMRP
jgi:hypothetical protein